MTKILLLLCLLPTLAFGQSVPNGGTVTNGQVWTVAQWMNAWQSKADTASPIFTGGMTLNGVGVTTNASPAFTGTITLNGVSVPTTASPAFTGAITLNGVGVPTVASPAFTGTPTIAGVPIPTYPTTAAETTACACTPNNLIYPLGNVLRYGSNTVPGTTDMTGAISGAISVALATGVQVVAPAGIYLYTSQINKTLPAGSVSLSIIGAGADATEFRSSAVSGGFGFTWTTETNTVHIRDITFTTTRAAGGTAITLFYGGAFGSILSLSDIENSVFRGADGYNVANYWTSAIVQNVVSALNVDNDTFTGKCTFGSGGNNCLGIGLVIQSTAGAATPAVLTNVTRSNFQALHQGINYGGFYQGLSVTATNFTGNDYGIFQSAALISNAQLSIVTSQFACNFDIYLLSGIVGTDIVGNYFISQFTGDIAITIAGTYDFTLSSNYFQALSTAANVRAIEIDTGSLTFGTAPTAGATSGTYSAPLVYGPGQAFNLVTSTGQSLRAFFTAIGSNAITWSPAIIGSPTTAATITAGAGVIQGNTLDNYSVGINLAPFTANVLVNGDMFNTPGAILIANQGSAAPALPFAPNSVINHPQYLTRNDGVTGAIATGATVAHGLAVTPTVVTLTQQDGTPTNVFPSAIGATTFTVNYAGGGTHAFAWQAR